MFSQKSVRRFAGDPSHSSWRHHMAPSKSRHYKEVELPRFSVPTFLKFLLRMLGKYFEACTPLTEHSKWRPTSFYASFWLGVRSLSYTIYLEIGLSTSRCPRKHGGCDVTGVKLEYGVHAVNHWPGLIYLQATQNSPPGQRVDTTKREMFSQKSVRRFVGDSSAFVMGAMFLASALKRSISPRY